jgi:hypothetical protein
MEHLLLQSLIRFVRWLNRRSLKPLRQAIPFLPALRADPKGTLQAQEVAIGPGRKTGSVLAATVIGSMLLWLAVCGGLLDFLGPPAPAPAPATVLLLMGVVLGGPVIIGLAAARFVRSRTGHAVLHHEGILLSCRHETVFCPWELFDTTGAPVRAGQDRVIVPVAAGSLPLIIVERKGLRYDGEPIRTRPLASKPGNEIVLRGLYEVDVVELATLFLAIGRRLGLDDPKRYTPAVEPSVGADSEAAWERKRGWICVRLSRLKFPDSCCGCGEPTSSRQSVRASPSIFSSGSGEILTENSGLELPVPVCLQCQNANRSLRRKYIFRGVALAFLSLLGLVILSIALIGANAPAGMASAFVVAAAALPVLLGAWSFSKARRMGVPVEVRDYSPKDGTVELRFRHPDYGQALLAAIGASQSEFA